MIVNVFGDPVHPAADGVTVIVAVTAAVPLLMAVNDGILPLPLAGKPIVGSLFVQLKLLFATAPVKFIEAVDDPLHKF